MPAGSWDCAQAWSKAGSLGGHLGAIPLFRVFSGKVGLGEVRLMVFSSLCMVKGSSNPTGISVSGTRRLKREGTDTGISAFEAVRIQEA